LPNEAPVSARALQAGSQQRRGRGMRMVVCARIEGKVAKKPAIVGDKLEVKDLLCGFSVLSAPSVVKAFLCRKARTQHRRRKISQRTPESTIEKRVPLVL
jgi:hypothetical protein